MLHKKIVLLSFIAITLGVKNINAADQSPNAKREIFLTQGREITKLDALKLMLSDSAAQVSRCVEVTLSDKGTIVTKKRAK